MNTDHVYKPGIARAVAEICSRATEVTAFCDTDRKLGADDMKVALDGQGRVAEMSKKLERYTLGYVGMTYVPADRVAAHGDAAHGVLDDVGETAHVEQVLVALAKAGSPPRVGDISGHGWLEIDEPQERAKADEVLRAERWWQLA
jgi:choline kinase